MSAEKSIGLLVHSACPSIHYRVRKEILGEPADDPTMMELQNRILQDKVVQGIFSWQREDGWLGDHFHGDHGPECGIRHLAEKGVESGNPVIQKTLLALKQKSDDFRDVSFCLGHVGRALDDSHAGGSSMILACVFAYAHAESHDFIQGQIREALAGFEYVLSVRSIEDIYTVRKGGKLVFRPGVMWPSIYHLRLLAFTDSWRNDENKRMLAASIGKLADFSPVPPVKVLEKNQIISPASAYMENFDPDMGSLTPKEWMMWFHRAEMIARLGIANDIPAISRQIDYLYSYIQANDWLFVKPLSHFYYNKWTQYIGLALENDWKANGARVNDLTFRSLLILHLANRL